MRASLLLACPLVAAALAPPAGAADGVLEINQTCVAVGCFAGDTPGFPVSITDAAPARSFRLTSDVVLASVGTTAIVVQTSFVHLDLAGFSLRGPATCAGLPPVCAPSGPSDGIAVDSGIREGVEVRNGSVSGFADNGVLLGNRGMVAGVIAFQNGGDGIEVGAGGTVRDSAASFNGVSGIVVDVNGTIVRSTAIQNALVGLDGRGEGATILESVARLNGSAGIGVATAAAVTDNTSTDNRLHGISASLGSSVRGNTVNTNLADGILCGDRCTVADNTVVGNGNVTAADGIECGVGCAVRENSVGLNRGFGLNLGTDSAYRENTITGNGTGTVSGGVNRNDNHCAGVGVGAATCP